MVELLITENEAGLRLDIFLSEKYIEFSRSEIQKKIEYSLVKIDNKEKKSGYKLETGNKIQIKEEFFQSEKDSLPSPMDIKIDIVYEDEDFAVINKPQGMVVHPGAGNTDETLANAILYKYGRENLSNLNGDERPGIVHRLDKDTSGLIIIAKNNFTHENLSNQFKNQKVNKEYIFICHGKFENKSFTIDEPLKRDEKNRTKITVSHGGRKAITHIEIIEELLGFTFGTAKIETGRTHQIRVHLSHINHPIVGDAVYSNRKEQIKGQLLHSKKIGIHHPRTGEYIEFESEVPERFMKFIKNNRSII